MIFLKKSTIVILNKPIQNYKSHATDETFSYYDLLIK